MTDLDLDAIEARAKVASAGRLNWQGIDALRSLVESDVPALVAALREARAKAKAAWEQAERDLAEANDLAAERDDWRRRYEALRDGVTGLADSVEYPKPIKGAWGLVLASDVRAVVARVEGDES